MRMSDVKQEAVNDSPQQPHDSKSLGEQMYSQCQYKSNPVKAGTAKKNQDN